jgi:hypothetical protein
MESEKGLSRVRRKYSTVGNISPSGASYSASICCSIGPRAFRKTWVFHNDYQLSNRMAEEVNERSMGIGRRRSVNRL